jgi:hypothetical protein
MAAFYETLSQETGHPHLTVKRSRAINLLRLFGMQAKCLHAVSLVISYEMNLWR